MSRINWWWLPRLGMPSKALTVVDFWDGNCESATNSSRAVVRGCYETPRKQMSKKHISTIMGSGVNGKHREGTVQH